MVSLDFVLPPALPLVEAVVPLEHLAADGALLLGENSIGLSYLRGRFLGQFGGTFQVVFCLIGLGTELN